MVVVQQCGCGDAGETRCGGGAGRGAEGVGQAGGGGVGRG